MRPRESTDDLLALYLRPDGYKVSHVPDVPITPADTARYTIELPTQDSLYAIKRCLAGVNTLFANDTDLGLLAPYPELVALLHALEMAVPLNRCPIALKPPDAGGIAEALITQFPVEYLHGGYMTVPLQSKIHAIVEAASKEKA